MLKGAPFELICDVEFSVGCTCSREMEFLDCDRGAHQRRAKEYLSKAALPSERFSRVIFKCSGRQFYGLHMSVNSKANLLRQQTRQQVARLAEVLYRSIHAPAPFTSSDSTVVMSSFHSLITCC